MRSLKVLILEHNPFQLMALHQMLNAMGIYDVLTAPTLDSALRSLGHRGAVDIAICDPQHEGGDGVALIRHLSQRQQAHALILVGRASPRLLKGLDFILLEHELRLLGRLQTPVSAVLMRSLVDDYLLSSRRAASV
ncbi:response regulator [Pseudomonas sp. PB106]|uniref:response regulator n=1 Tax=Pseudomonas sp. PB106 TaxID=2494699 RepID=UPI00131DDEF5|nr:response regulator [Pseudomonas sp. PB106]KAE9646732.1 response regulator [Pseudomonas sp. PB106]